jgi:hypothetical protein
VLSVVGDQALILQLLLQLEILQQLLLEVERPLQLHRTRLLQLAILCSPSRCIFAFELWKNTPEMICTSVLFMVPRCNTLFVLTIISRVMRHRIPDVDFILEPVHTLYSILHVIIVLASLASARAKCGVLYGSLVVQLKLQR